MKYFNPRAPCGARRVDQILRVGFSRISIHAPRVGRDAAGVRYQGQRAEISIHAPRVGRDSGIRLHRRAGFISIHAPRVGRDVMLSATRLARLAISIHAPRVGRDLHSRAQAQTPRHFNPRAPCGARPPDMIAKAVTKIFQSTRPVWGATRRERILGCTAQFQSTRPVWGATRVSRATSSSGQFQSTRPVWGATLFFRHHATPSAVFQSTRPVWGATRYDKLCHSVFGDFNPRAPCGARPV